MKLKSSQGASIVIALVFMLFCVFVGGSVLTAATVNSYRIKDMAIKEQQNKLNEESACLYIADSLGSSDDQQIKITITETFESKLPVDIDVDGTITPKEAGKTTNHMLKIEVDGSPEMSAIQRLMVETAIRQYMIEPGPAFGTNAKVSISGLTWSHVDPVTNAKVIDDITSLDQFWIPKAESAPLSVPFEMNCDLFEEPIGVKLKCTNEYAHDKFAIDLSLDMPTESKMKVHMSSTISEKQTTPEAEVIPDHPNDVNTKLTTGKKVTKKIKKSVISWTSPRIEKEGVR